jgi:hypothetical protein
MRVIWMMIVVLSSVSGCGDDTSTSKSTTPPAVQTRIYTLSGTVRNLRSGAVLVLQNNGGDSVIVQAETKIFSFPTQMAAGRSYNVVIHTQLGQKCVLKNGVGTVAAADIKDIAVECSKVDNVKLANERKEFTSSLQLNEGFIVPKNGRANDASGEDPTIECATKIESKKDIRVLNAKIKFDNLSIWPFNAKDNKNFAGKTEQKVIFKSLAELKKCKKSGDDWRKNNYFKEINSVVDKNYADIFALTVNLYAKKISYLEYAKQNLNIRKNFTVKANQAIQQIHAHQAETQHVKELGLQQEAEKQGAEALAKQQEEEKKLAEKARLEALQKQENDGEKLAEQKRSGTLSQKEEEQMMLAEEQRIKDLELQKKQKIEYEKHFQPLRQRQQIDRLH